MNRFIKAVEQAKKALLDSFEFTALVDEAIDKYDLVEVVRCKDCKWFDEFCDERKKQVDADGRCNKIGLRRDADWFCADGERRDPCSSQDS